MFIALGHFTYSTDIYIYEVSSKIGSKIIVLFARKYFEYIAPEML